MCMLSDQVIAFWRQVFLASLGSPPLPCEQALNYNSEVPAIQGWHATLEKKSVHSLINIQDSIYLGSIHALVLKSFSVKKCG